MDFQAIVVIGFRFSYITNRPNKVLLSKISWLPAPFFLEALLSFCLQILQSTAKCMFSSFPVLGTAISQIMNGSFYSGLLRFITPCRDWRDMLNDASKCITSVEIHRCSCMRHTSFHFPPCLFNSALFWARLSGLTKV